MQHFKPTYLCWMHTSQAQVTNHSCLPRYQCYLSLQTTLFLCNDHSERHRLCCINLCQPGASCCLQLVWSLEYGMPSIIAMQPSVAGDLMTALLLANLYKDPDNMQHAVEQAIASLQAILLASAEASGDAAHATERTAEVIKCAVLSCACCIILSLPALSLQSWPVSQHSINLNSTSFTYCVKI